VTPDAVIVPMIAFDDAGFRLGYGGGYFDITLAAIAPRPIAIGVCYDMFKLQSLDPQPHDIRMDFVVTETGIYVAREEKLERLEYEASAERAAMLARERLLPRVQNPEHRTYSSPVCFAKDVAPDYFGSEKS
jgi:5-formyltetrahydrofolate cyclo-ligase